MIVSQFSCGAASAVATKLAIADYGIDNIRILNAFLTREDSDNRRFLADCEVWFGKKIEVVADTKYGADPFEVFRRKRFIKGPRGAPCTEALKRSVLRAAVDDSDTFVLGYTSEEVDRIEKFTDANPGRKIITPLADRYLNKNDCFAILDRAGIEIPRSYRKGYPNGNCQHCPKGGQAYHQNCREDFPESFAELVQIQDVIGPGSYFLRFRSGPRKGERMSLRELPAGRGDMKSEPDFECGVLCELAESDFYAKGATMTEHDEQIRSEIARLNALPCECISCDDCRGTGRISYQPQYQIDEESEPCDRCSDGIVEACQRCLEIEELNVMPELKPELLPCPNVCCQSDPMTRMKRGKIPLFVVICGNCGWSSPAAKPTKAEAITDWNRRPPSELERLAREVARQYRLDSLSEMTAELSDPIDELALYFERLAEPQKGKA